MQRISTDEFRRADKLPLRLILDNVRSLNNVGAMFRTCDAFRVASIELCGITACPPSPEIHKTALGAEDSVLWHHWDSASQAIASLQSRGVVVCCLEQVKGSISLPDFVPDKGREYAIVVGHEVDGVSQEAVDLSDCCLEIPQHGTKHSLNVSVSAAIALWQFYLALR